MASSKNGQLRIQARDEILAFVKELARNYRRLFKDGCYKDVCPYSMHTPYNPFDVTLEIKRKDWSLVEIVDFLGELNEKQLLFFRILNESKEIDRDNLIKKIAIELTKTDFGKNTLAGVLEDIEVRTNSLKKEALYEEKWRPNGYDAVCYYRLLPGYELIVSKWFEDKFLASFSHTG